MDRTNKASIISQIWERQDSEIFRLFIALMDSLTEEQRETMDTAAVAEIPIMRVRSTHLRPPIDLSWPIPHFHKMVGAPRVALDPQVPKTWMLICHTLPRKIKRPQRFSPWGRSKQSKRSKVDSGLRVSSRIGARLRCTFRHDLCLHTASACWYRGPGMESLFHRTSPS